MITSSMSATRAPILSELLTDTRTFSIKSSASSFRILSSSLYSNPIAAIIRELSCNARDSHVEAGNTKPFKVHVPTMLDPTFYVQDFGTGLGHDQVMSLYTTFFESTKTSSNDYVGALGLGSKSPFSYTDNFTVVAIKDGVKNVYSAFINDAGIPSIVRGHSEHTTEHSGVKVEFAVESKDFKKFSEEAVSILQWFDQLPTINISVSKIQVMEFAPLKDVVIDFDDLGVRSTHRQWQYRGYTYGGTTMPSMVIMGGVSYKIDSDHKGLSAHKALLNCGLVIDVPIGAVEPTPSRESLTYTQETLATLCGILTKISTRIKSVISIELDSISSKFEQAAFLHSIDATHLVGVVRDLMHDRGLVGIEIDIKTDVLKQYNVQMRRFTNKNGYTLKLRSDGIISDFNVSAKHAARSVLYGYSSSRMPSGRCSVKFVWDDIGVKVSDVTSTTMNDCANLVVLFGAGIKDKATRDKIEQQYLHGMSIKPISSCVKPIPTTKSVKTECYVFRVENEYRSWRTVSVVKSHRETQIPATATCYVEMSKAKPEESHGVAGFSTDFMIEHIGANKVVGLLKSSKTDRSTLISLDDAFARRLGDEVKKYSTPKKFKELVIYELSAMHQISYDLKSLPSSVVFDDAALNFRTTSTIKLTDLMERSNMRDRVIVDGMTPSQKAKQIAATLEKYTALNFGTADHKTLVLLANHIYAMSKATPQVEPQADYVEF